MRRTRLATLAFALAAPFALSACDTYGYGGYGYSSVSLGYGSRGWCDPYYYDCRYYGGYGYGYNGYGADPYWGWWGNYYYPGIGFYIYDSFGRRYPWNEQYRRYWEGRRGTWGHRNWSDPRWQRWDGYRHGGTTNGTTGGTWHGRTGTTGTWSGHSGSASSHHGSGHHGH
jgi:hypothetical protein